MKQSYEVIWAETAEKDLQGIVSYIAQDNPSQARKILQKIKKSASTLTHSPLRGRVVPELKEQGIIQYRELIIAPWRLIYRVSAQVAFVVSVLDSRRNIEDLLLSRFLMR
ncbi:MAG: type II toxin-antitoxin system RelE/ParE family toxin [Nitrospirales bacterium]|nr:type II toxin-antitoxin system RelE/ParE family toxin [Nitrospira sp.]MDR4500990.1 type II toxin-antitoxin system RelE/ParE family toxin [Nitrospirales bacterium]